MQHKILIPEYLQSSESFTPNNIVVTGSPTINSSGVMSNLSNSDYVSVPTNFAPNGNWECVMCVKPYSTKTAQSSWTSMDDACVLGIPNGYYGWVDPIVYTKQPNVGIFVTTNGVLITINKSTYSGDSTNVGSILRTDITFSNSQFYDIKVEYTGSAYNAYYKLHSASSWTSLGTISSSNTIGECALTVGYTYRGTVGNPGADLTKTAYFNGQIDLFNSYIKINGNYFWMNKKIIQSGLVPQPHSVDTMKYLKKTGTQTAWTQPILSANGTLGGSSFAVSATPGNSSYPIWKAFDGLNNTQGNVSGSGNHELIIYNPVAFKISNIAIYNGNAVTVQVSSGGSVYGSNDNSSYTLITTYTNTNNSGTGTWNIDLSSNNNNYQYYKVTYDSIINYGTSGNWYIGEITITATTGTEIWSAGTSSNYTLKKPLCHSVNVPKYLKKTTTSTAWTQPILSANGTLGGSSFAVVDAVNSSYDLWKGFDGSDSTYGICGVGTSTFILYNPTPLKITQFSYKFGAYGQNWQVYGSDDNSSWTQITVSQSPNSTEGTVILSGDSGYKYHKIVFQQGATYGLMVYFINITATTGTEIWSAGTSSNYTIIK